MTSTSSSDASSSMSVNLTSLPKPLLLEVMSLLDAPSLQQLRLTNKLLRTISDEMVTSLNYGTMPDCCNRAEVEYVAERWPSIKIIKLFYPHQIYEPSDADAEELTRVMEAFLRTKWTAIEEIRFSKAISNINDLTISGVQALAACTVSWGRLRKLKMQGNVSHDGLKVLATHGEFLSLQELDLSCSDFHSDSTLAGAALAKFVSRTPKLSKLKLRHSYLGMGLLPLFETELPSLEIINLGRAGVYDMVLPKLDPEKWPGLSTLVLKRNFITPLGLKWLLEKDWKALKHLDVSCTVVGPEGIECLNAATLAGRLPSLTSLVSVVAGISSESFALACESNLERLEIIGGNLAQDGMLHFIASVQAQRFPALRSLNMQYCQFSKDAWNVFLSITWNHLEELTLDSRRLAPEHFADLAGVVGNFFPKLRILKFMEKKDGERIYIDTSTWHQIFETLLHTSWPSLMRVECKNCSQLPEKLIGWKVTKSARGKKTVVLERIGRAIE